MWCGFGPERVYDDLRRAADPEHHPDDARDGWLGRHVAGVLFLSILARITARHEDRLG